MATSKPPQESDLIERDVRPDAKRRQRGPNCQIVLDPQVSIPASEAWLYRTPKALSAVQSGLEEAADGKAVSIGFFAKYADTE